MAKRIQQAPVDPPPPPTPTPTPAPDAADQLYRYTANDVFELSAQLGPATKEDVILLTEGQTDDQLIETGNDFATERATDDALRILGVAASFFQRAPADARDAVDLTADVVRIGAWAAAEDARLNAEFLAAKAGQRTGAAGAVAAANAVMEAARSEKHKLADTVRSVARSAEVNVAVAHALAPAAQGLANPGPDVSLALLVEQGRALVDSADPAVRRRAALFRLTTARLDLATATGKKAALAAKVLNRPEAVVTQDTVDWWDGSTFVILQAVARAFKGGRATHAGVPRVGFVSLRKRVNSGAAEATPAGNKPPPAGNKLPPAGTE